MSLLESFLLFGLLGGLTGSAIRRHIASPKSRWIALAALFLPVAIMAISVVAQGCLFHGSQCRGLDLFLTFVAIGTLPGWALGLVIGYVAGQEGGTRTPEL